MQCRHPMVMLRGGELRTIVVTVIGNDRQSTGN